MKAIEFLKSNGITKATCYTDGNKTYYVNELAELMEEYAALRQPPVIKSVCTCTNAQLEKDSLVPVYCHNCNAYVQTDL